MPQAIGAVECIATRDGFNYHGMVIGKTYRCCEGLLPIVVAWLHLDSRDERLAHSLQMWYNVTAVIMVNKMTSKHSVAARLLRCLSFVTARGQISLSACHLPKKDNCATDALSRGDLPRFMLCSGDAEPSPTLVPEELIDCLLVSMPDWPSQLWRAVLVQLHD